MLKSCDPLIYEIVFVTVIKKKISILYILRNYNQWILLGTDLKPRG